MRAVSHCPPVKAIIIYKNQNRMWHRVCLTKQYVLPKHGIPKLLHTIPKERFLFG